MATLTERKSTTNPREGTFHVVKAGEGVPEYSYRIMYESILAAIKDDHPVVIPRYATYDNFPTSGVKIGAPAIARDENRLYVYDIDGWRPASNSSSETFGTTNTEVYSETEIYIAGNVFVSYVNEASGDELFQEAAIYRSRLQTVAGISPEDSLYDAGTNPEGKWEYQGQKVVIQSGGLARVFYDSIGQIKGITDYKDGDNAVDKSAGQIYKYDSTATDGLQPNDNTESSGRWVEDGTFGTGGGTSGLPSTWETDAAAIRALTTHDAGMDVGNYATGAIYEYDDSLTTDDDGDTYLKPDDVTEAGRWVKRIEFAKKSDIRSKTYTIDFGLTSYAAQEINMFGAGTIVNIATNNIDTILLSYSGGLQQAVNAGENSISIMAGDVLTWEITRITESQIASLGVSLTLNE